jgi:hypothetical protein
MAEKAGELGRRLARRFIVRDVRPQVRDLAAELEVSIVERGAPPPAQPRVRSEYRADPPCIILYRHPIDRLSVAIHANQRFDMMNCRLDEVHIAHELFHHLESSGRVGILAREDSERAAHAFAEQLLGLSFSPTELSELLG